MPDARIRASAAALPKTAEQLDTELLQLVDKCLEAERRSEASLDQLEAAELRSRPVPMPAALKKTERDIENRLCVGEIGSPYGAEEIELLRAFVRASNRRQPKDIAAYRVQERAAEIVKAWADWNAEKENEERASGLDAANAQDIATHRERDTLLRQIAEMQALTIQGVLAKTRASRREFPLMEGIDATIADGLHEFGPDIDVMLLSIGRDLLALAMEGMAR